MTPRRAGPALITASLLALSRLALAQAAAPLPALPSPTPASASDAAIAGSEPTDAPWCFDGESIEALTPTLCHFSPAPPEAAPDTLVIFLHGVTKLGTTWQWSGQRGLARAARANGFEVIMPRGRLGAGSAKFADHWNWPSSAEGQRTVESEVIDEWLAAKQTLERRNGKPFRRVYVFGFSAGAYYAASLALRGRLTVDGYGVFAGGGAPKGVERWAKGTRPKPPIYVGYGFKDRAYRDPQRLGRALGRMGWKHRVVGRRQVGHSMTDAQIREALGFLGGTPSTKAEAVRGTSSAQTRTKGAAPSHERPEPHRSKKPPRNRKPAKKTGKSKRRG